MARVDSCCRCCCDMDERGMGNQLGKDPELQGPSDDLWVSIGNRRKKDATSDRTMKRKISQLQRCLMLDAAVRLSK